MTARTPIARSTALPASMAPAIRQMAGAANAEVAGGFPQNLGEYEAGRARFPVHGPRLNLRQIPRSLRNLSVYSSAVVPETELQVGDAYVVVVAQGVSRSSDQKCSPARPLLFT